MVRYVFAALVCCAFEISCGNPVFDRGYAQTPEGLGRAVVDALNEGSEEKLHRLRADKNQYVDDLWPAFLTRYPANNFTAEFAWDNLNKKCIRGVKKWVRRYGEKEYEFVRIQFTEPTQEYSGFNIRRGTVLTVKTPDGQERRLAILGSVIEKPDSYRLLSYED